MFSGFYIALLLLLVLLIVRVVSFEWRGKAESAGWRAVWTWLNTIAAFGIPLIWGIALSSLLHGVPISSEQEFTGTFWDLFTPYTVVAGIAFVLLFALHGAVYLTLRTQRRPPRPRRANGQPHRDRRRRSSERRSSSGRSRSGSTRTTRTSSPASSLVALAAVAAVAAVVLAHLRPRGARVRRNRGDDRARRRPAVHRALPAGDGLVDELRRQPHDLQRVVGPLHADRDEHLRARPAARHPALPVLELPRLPGPARARRSRSRTLSICSGRRAADPAGDA